MGPFEALHEAMWRHLAGDLAGAEAIFRQIQAEPAASVARPQLIRLLRQQSRWEEALEVVRRHAETHPRNPEIAYYLAMSLLGLARYPEGFSHYESRRWIPGFAPALTSAPEWKGEAAAHLVVLDEQGFGDTIMFARYVAQLAAGGHAVTLVCRPALLALFEASLAGVAAVRTDLPPAFDAWTFLGTLPLRLRTGPEESPRPPYLKPPEDRRSRWAAQLPDAARIGVATRGNNAHPNNANRSLPPDVAAFVRSFPGAVSLDVPGGSLTLTDFADTAAVIERLDLVISVDTAVAHLAGALGKPCWLLLPQEGADWRWLHDGDTSAWYPSFRLYRQPKAGDWLSVMAALRRDVGPFLQAASVARGSGTPNGDLS